MKKVIFYDRTQFESFKTELIKDHNVISFSRLLSDYNDRIKMLSENDCIDLSCLIPFLTSSGDKIIQFEQLFNGIDDTVLFICDKQYEDELRYSFRFVFDAFEYTHVEEQCKAVPSNLESLSKPRKIVDLDEQELEIFFRTFDSKLYGHARFKTDFKQLIASFRVFNRIGEHKILSLFLMGDSGVGKTEVARSIHKALGGKTKLAKINFGNYSSHDALNSLIGSPRGYVGSENGELIKRVKDSDIGLILIDEFEKADTPVFNYFLDVLENGKITDSQGDEYDADGYIIVFTSNMTPEEYKQKISPELKSRLDYKGIFNLLTDDDKTKYMHYRVNQIIDAYRTKVDQNLPEDIHEQIVSQLNVSKYKNMRDLNKDIKDIFVRIVSISNE